MIRPLQFRKSTFYSNPMNTILLAFDSFKGSLTSREVADAFEEGVRSVVPDCQVRKVWR